MCSLIGFSVWVMVSGATLDIDSRVLFMVCIENEHMKMEKNFGIGTATSECNNFV